MNEAPEAHFLHRRQGLTLALRPGIRGPTALAWSMSGDLVVGNSRGDGFAVHPSLGTRVLWERAPMLLGVGRVSVDLVIVDASGWRRIDPAWEVVAKGDHRFTGPVQIVPDGEHFLLVGDSATDRRVELIEQHKRVLRVLLPPCATAYPTLSGLTLARTVRGGVEVVTPGQRFSGKRGTDRPLLRLGDGLVALEPDQLHRYHLDGRHDGTFAVEGPASVTAVDAAAQHLMVGTTDGSLVWIDTAPGGSPPHQIRAHDDAVHAVAASPGGDWVASAASSLCLWTLDQA